MAQALNRPPAKHIVISSIVFVLLIGMALVFAWGGIKSYNYSLPEAWKEYSFAEDNFWVSFPSEPKKETKEVGSGQNESVEYSIYSSESKTGVLYTVSVVTSPVPIDISRSNEFLDKVIRSSASAAAGLTLESVTASSFGQYPASDYLIKSTEKGKAGYLKGKYIIVDKSMYGLQVVSEDKEVPDYAKFIKSFGVINK